MNTVTTTEKLPTVYAVIWKSEFQGDVPGDQIKGGYFTREEALNHPQAGEKTYDGALMSSRGSFQIVELQPSDRLKELAEKGAEFGRTESGMIGCWLDGKPVQSCQTSRGGDWAWDGEEYQYLESLKQAQGK